MSTIGNSFFKPVSHGLSESVYDCLLFLYHPNVAEISVALTIVFLWMLRQILEIYWTSAILYKWVLFTFYKSAEKRGEMENILAEKSHLFKIWIFFL